MIYCALTTLLSKRQYLTFFLIKPQGRRNCFLKVTSLSENLKERINYAFLYFKKIFCIIYDSALPPSPEESADCVLDLRRLGLKNTTNVITKNSPTHAAAVIILAVILVGA